MFSYIKPEPNHKTFGLYFNLRVYNWVSGGKDRRIKRWLRNTIGEEPVILDTAMVENSGKQLRYYLNNHGYFNSVVTHKIRYRKKKAKVSYTVNCAIPYTIRNISYQTTDALLKPYIYSYASGTFLVKGDKYNVDNLDKEREAITKNLLNDGFYYFSKEFVTFKIDTGIGSHQLDIAVNIARPLLKVPGYKDSTVAVNHKRYYIHRIYIHSDYRANTHDTIARDTVRAVIPNRVKGRSPKVYYLIHPAKLRIKAKTLTQSVFFDSSDYYCYDKVEQTYNSLLGLKLFRYATILFNPSGDSLQSTGLLNCNIYLTRAPVQGMAVEAVATNTGGELGIAGALVYENKNIFRGAEILNLKLNGAVEVQKLNLGKDDEVISKLPLFNTIEYSIEAGLKVPRFLLPVRQERFGKNFRPKTNINAGYNYQLRPDYHRYLVKGSFGYEWKESALKTHMLTPFDVNAVSIFPDSLFKARIDALQDRILQNTYRDHISTALKYSFIYNTQQPGKIKDFLYFRGNFEVAGFLFWLSSYARGTPGAYLFLNIPYSQFYRIDADFRYYAMFSEKNSLVWRAAAGYGAPLNKYNVLPFEKSFYMGGANSMRGWRLKNLGPGSYNEPDSASFDRTGDISIELNVEYRFPIYNLLRGAVFIDAGNIWLRKQSEQYPGGSLSISDFPGEIAIDGGAGIRLDFGFFIIRLDGAIKLKDPSEEAGKRWIFQNDSRKVLIGNIGIGYPF